MWEALTDLIRSKAEYYRKQAEAADKPIPKSEGMAAWLTAWGTWGAVIAALIAAGIFWRQLDTMQHDSVDSAAAFLEGNRAYIIRSDKTEVTIVRDAKNVPSQLVINPKFLNTGKTPAFRVACNSGLSYTETGLGIAEKNSGEDYVGPEQLAGCKMLIISASDMVASYKHEKTVYYWMRVDYFDAFKDTPPRHTAMCGAIRVNIDPTKPIDPAGINSAMYTIETGSPRSCNSAS